MLTIETPIGTGVRTVANPSQAGRLARVEMFEYGDPIFWVEIPGLYSLTAFDYDELVPTSPDAAKGE